MPRVDLILYADQQGRSPVLEWLDTLKPKARAKCYQRLEVLRNSGYEILAHRNFAAHLRDQIYELRFQWEGAQYRVLFFFDGAQVVVASHGFDKEAQVPEGEIERAIRYRAQYQNDPHTHTYREETE